MSSFKVKSVLEAVIARYRKTPFAVYTAEPDFRRVEQFGTPESPADFCQVQAQVLERFVEDGTDAVYIAISGDDGFSHFGADLVVYADGRSRVTGAPREFRGGVPTDVSDT